MVMTHICVMSSHKPILIYMGVLILGVNTLYRLFCFFKLFLMVGKGLLMLDKHPFIDIPVWGRGGKQGYSLRSSPTPN